MRRRSTVLLLTTLALAGSAAAAPARAAGLSGGQEGPVARRPDEEESAMVETLRALLNASRRELGIDELRSDPALDLLAYQHARDMAERGTVSHHSYRYGLDTQSRIRLAFPRIRQFAENVARNRDVAALHRALMTSAGHRLNRLDESFTHAGIGVARAGEYEVYVAEILVRAINPDLLVLEVLYTEAPPQDLPADEPVFGEVTAEAIRVGAPDSSNPEYYTRIGVDLFAEGRFADAVDAFRKALAVDPTYGYAQFNLGRALLRAGRPAEALETLEAYLAHTPGDIDAWRSVGTAALVQGEYPRAEQAFRRVLQQAARDAAAWYNLGLSLEYQGRLEDAEGAYAQALHLDPDLLAARDALSRIRR